MSRRGRERARKAAVDARRADALTILVRSKIRYQLGLRVTFPGYLNGRPIVKVMPPFDRSTLPVRVVGGAG